MKLIIAYLVPLLSMTALQGGCTHPQAKQQVPPAVQTQPAPGGSSTAQAATGNDQAGQAASLALGTAAGAKLFKGEGVVEGVDRSIDTIQINHGDIKGYMPAMSMPYRVKDKAMLDVAKRGDKVTFVLEDTGHGAVLVEIKKAAP
ncbi:MAG TPA: copper-binding protein [Blastocatellia bacterium]|nr:copper-binding protein [Blastocatellia bacterium]